MSYDSEVYTFRKFFAEIKTSRSGSIPSCICPSGLCNALYTYKAASEDKAKFVI